jgi:hypothetical protein
MPKRASNSAAAEPEPAAARAREGESGREVAEIGPETLLATPELSSVASHDALFAPSEVPQCDACGCDLDAEQELDQLGGRGVYMWTRGDEIRFEDAPLCPSCASAIGMTALARWEIEEEEG